MNTEYSFSNLTPADVSVICSYLSLPTPTPDVSLSTITEQRALTPQTTYAALAQTTDIRVMIAAAALRKISRLPRDPRLDPAPLPPLKSAPARGTPATPPQRPMTGRRRPQSSWMIPGSQVLTCAPNPRRPGTATHTRYAHYAVGRLCSDLLALGMTNGDFRWDVEHGFVTFGLPPEKTPETDPTSNP